MQAHLGIPVLNKGRAGETAADGLRRLERDVIAHRPRLCIVEFGVNEAFRGQPFSSCIHALDLILQRLKGIGIPALVVGVRFGSYGEEFDAALRILTAAHGAGLVVDALRGVLDDRRLSDGYHPNSAGYAILESRILPEVQRMLGLHQ